jgi:hypothetical protein
MGLNYCYALLVEKSKELLLRTHILQAGSLEELAAPFGTCAVLDFPLDEPLEAYLKKTVRERFGPSWRQTLYFRKRDYREHFPTDTTGRVGCIYVELLPLPADEHMYACFTAATSDMSKLFQQSSSIRSWFRQLSQVAGAKAAFLDLEADGYDFLYYQGHAVAAQLTENLARIQPTALEQQGLVEIARQYAELISLH